jgi:hypothetical protein
MTEKRPVHLWVVGRIADGEGEADQIDDIVDHLMGAMAAQMAELGLRGGVDGADKLRNSVREIVIDRLLWDRYRNIIDALTSFTMEGINKMLRRHGCGHLAGSSNLRAEVQEQVSVICLETGVHDIEKLRALMATTVTRWVAIVLSRKSQ